MADSSASFIPKNTQRLQKKVRTTHRIYLLSYLSYVFFFGTLFAVLATYFYAIQVSNELENVKERVSVARQQFSPTELKEIRALEQRLLLVTEMVNTLVAPSKLFADIEKITAENIQFIRFSYELLPNNKVAVTLEGKADTFNQILFQNDLLNSSSIFESAEIKQFEYAGVPVSDSEVDPLVANDARLTFVFANEITSSLFPYTPLTPNNSETVVTSVRGLDDSTAEVLSPESVTELPVTPEATIEDPNNANQDQI